MSRKICSKCNIIYPWTLEFFTSVSNKSKRVCLNCSKNKSKGSIPYWKVQIYKKETEEELGLSRDLYKECDCCKKEFNLNKSNFRLQIIKNNTEWSNTCLNCERIEKQRKYEIAKQKNRKRENEKRKNPMYVEKKREAQKTRQAKKQKIVNKRRKREEEIRSKFYKNVDFNAIEEEWIQREQKRLLIKQRTLISSEGDSRKRFSPSSAFRRYMKENAKTNQIYAQKAGYEVVELREHIESLFEPGMNWDNYGTGWHLDHIIPWSRFLCNMFFAGDVDHPHYKLCWGLKNLRPQWANKNMAKSNKIEIDILVKYDLLDVFYQIEKDYKDYIDKLEENT